VVLWNQASKCNATVDVTLIRPLNKGQGHSFWYQSISHIRLPKALNSNFCSRTHRLATILHVTDDRRNSVPIARPLTNGTVLVRSANNTSVAVSLSACDCEPWLLWQRNKTSFWWQLYLLIYCSISHPVTIVTWPNVWMNNNIRLKSVYAEVWFSLLSKF